MSVHFSSVRNTIDENVIESVTIGSDTGILKTYARQFLHAGVAHNGNVTVPITTLNQWTTIEGNLFTEHHSSQDIDLINSYTIRLSNSGIYQVSLSLPLGIEGAVINSVDIGVSVNGTEPHTPIMFGRPFSSTLPDGASGVIIDPYNKNDELTLVTRNKESTNNILILQEGNFTISYLGEIPPLDGE